MYHIRRSGLCGKTEWWDTLITSYKGSECRLADGVLDVGLARFSSLATERSVVSDFSKRVTRQAGVETYQLSQWWATNHALLYQSPFQLVASHGFNMRGSSFARCFTSRSAQSNGKNESEARKEVSTVEDPFDAPTYNIPEKPVTFTEGASYSLVILAGLGVAAAAAYGVFKELIFEPKEYKIFNKALERVQNDSQVRVRIGSPITGYGSESRNRAARQRIPNRTWTDEDGIEHVLVNFRVRGPHGAGKVHAEMFKDSVDMQWKFVYLIVEVTSPSQAQLMLESYVPA